METVVGLGDAEPRAWLDNLAAKLAQRPGYTVVEEPERLTVSRSYISDNRLVGSVILGFFTLGLGLLLLTRRDTESFTVTVGGEGTSPDRVARISGEWTADTETLIAQGTRTESVGVVPQASAEAGEPTPDPTPEPTLEPVQEAVEVDSDPEPPAYLALLADGDGDTDGADATRRVTSPRGESLVFEIHLDDGQKWTLGAINIIGRGPSVPSDVVGQAQLIEIADPTQSVSKNHAKVLIEEQALRVIDLNSTNGTSLLLADGQRVAVDTEVGVIVPAGAVVEIGERTFTVSGVDHAGSPSGLSPGE